MADVSIHLDPPMLASARAGRFPFLSILAAAIAEAGLAVCFRPEDAAPAPCSLWHMRRPAHPGALIFRRTYHYPFWHIERDEERWAWPVARAAFPAGDVPPGPARAFVRRLVARVLPGPPPRRDGPLLVPLQGQLRVQRSFQTMAPLAMLAAVGRSGVPAVATLHPRERYDDADRAALDAVLGRHPSLSLAPANPQLLRGASGVVTMNSAVGFDGLILGKPLALFALADFHHVALKLHEGADPAALIARLAAHRAPTAAYVHWFLGQAINASAPDAGARIRAVLAGHGWPTG